MKKLFFIALLLVLTLSCTDSQQAKIGGFGDNFKVELVNCDGSVTHSWISTGKVLSEETSDGYYFLDSESGELIEVSGTLIITRLSKKRPTAIN